MRSCSRASGAGAHQFHRPRMRMKAGTRISRTKVASTRIASVRPTPNIRMNDTCAAIRAAKEIDMTSAAAVMTRPVRATPSATLSSMSARGASACQPVLADPGDQEHLVVHRQSERDAEQQDGHGGDQRAGRCGSERAQMAVLKDPHQRAERGGQRKNIEDKRFDRQHHAAGQQEQQRERDDGDDGQHQRHARGDRRDAVAVDLGHAGELDGASPGVATSRSRSSCASDAGENNGALLLTVRKALPSAIPAERRGGPTFVPPVKVPVGALTAPTSTTADSPAAYRSISGSAQTRRIGDHDRHRARGVVGETLAHPVTDLMRRRRPRQDAIVGETPLDSQERQAGHDQHRASPPDRSAARAASPKLVHRYQNWRRTGVGGGSSRPRSRRIRGARPRRPGGRRAPRSPPG